ncbi:MAG: hypothetical protein JXA89_21275 [Anaerolineae bacterium]|nr:hypothetical protein [Anaerolineae bacterium]
MRRRTLGGSGLVLVLLSIWQIGIASQGLDLVTVTLILPAFPAILGVPALVAGSYRQGWIFASSGALLTSWALLAIFPLQFLC